LGLILGLRHPQDRCSIASDSTSNDTPPEYRP
jgi:hypothetical protein